MSLDLSYTTYIVLALLGDISYLTVLQGRRKGRGFGGGGASNSSYLFLGEFYFTFLDNLEGGKRERSV